MFNTLQDSGSNAEDGKDEIEYQSLREEILTLSSRQLTILNLGLTATIIFFGYNFSLKEKNPIIFLAPVLILSLTLIQLIHDHYSILHIAGYLRVFQGGDKKWESWVFEFRKSMSQKLHTKLTNTLLPDPIPISTNGFFIYYIWITVLTGIACITISAIYGFDTYSNSIRQIGHLEKQIDWDALVFFLLWFPMSLWWCRVSYVGISKINKRRLTYYEIKYERKVRNYRRKIDNV